MRYGEDLTQSEISAPVSACANAGLTSASARTPARADVGRGPSSVVRSPNPVRTGTLNRWPLIATSLKSLAQELDLMRITVLS